MKLFWRIFLTFWLATLLMIGFVLIMQEFLPSTFTQERERAFDREVTESVLVKAVNAYEQHGDAAFFSQLQKEAALHGSVYLLDKDERVLAKNASFSPANARIARQALDAGHATMVRLGFHWMFVSPVQSATGRHYVVIATVFEPWMRLLRPRFWLNRTLALLPAAIVCLVLSLYITRPIVRLQKTVQRLAEGDFNARSSPDGIARRDELGDLTRDFDVMAARIQSLMTAQRRFVADVSHEIGSPLTRMNLAVALLRRELDGRNSTALERIEREESKLRDLVQQLLLVAQMEAGSCLAETLKPISVRSLCQSIVEDADFEAQQRGCRVACSCQDATLLAYSQLLRRAISNVLRNAIRYAPGGTNVSLDGKVNTDLQQAIVEIRDCGPGVPDEMLSNIFLPFFRASSGGDGKSGGAGLGLAIASEAVRLHGGTITAQNRKSGGLQVTIVLPFRAPALQSMTAPAAGENVRG